MNVECEIQLPPHLPPIFFLPSNFSCIKVPHSFKMPERKCEICKRNKFNPQQLGPFIQTKTISAHFNCVLFSPINPSQSSRRNNPDDDAIAGMSARFVRKEGARAKKLVYNFRKQLFHHVFNHYLLRLMPIFIFSDLQLLQVSRC